MYGRIWHFPWPDHHPPPFGVLIEVVESLARWFKTEDDDGEKRRVAVLHCKGIIHTLFPATSGHFPLTCLKQKAGKGRSGTVAAAYLISQAGWSVPDALARFTERRMRAGFGQGVSIPSQVRWVGYMARWTRAGKVYVERRVEVVEVHVWGLRDGVKVGVRAFEKGSRGERQIRCVHPFGKGERWVIDGRRGEDAQEGARSGRRLRKAKTVAQESFSASTSASPASSSSMLAMNGKQEEKADEKVTTTTDTLSPFPPPPRSNSTSNMDSLTPSTQSDRRKSSVDPSSTLLKYSNAFTGLASSPSSSPSSGTRTPESTISNSDTEPGGAAVLFKPCAPTRIILPTNDINIDFERRNTLVGPGRLGWTMVTSVAHVWFNTFLEGAATRSDSHDDRKRGDRNVSPAKSSSGASPTTTAAKHDATTALRTTTSNAHSGPEVLGRSSGVFSIAWDDMDGIKGSTRKGVRAFDRLAVVWRVVDDDEATSGSETALEQADTVQIGQQQQDNPAHDKQANDLLMPVQQRELERQHLTQQDRAAEGHRGDVIREEEENSGGGLGSRRPLSHPTSLAGTSFV